MKYRKFGKLDFQVSALGFGAMRLPTEGSGMGSDRLSDKIVEDEAIRMIRYAIDNGVNYIDTAYVYHKCCGEIILGKALKDGYRDKVMLATKSPVWMIKSAEDFDRMLDEQLSKLQTDCIDCYLLHALSKDRWRDIVLKFDLLKRAEAAKQAGKIKYLGFSFHDQGDVFTEIIDGYDKWDFCQIQYNYMDIENQTGTKGLKYAASKGIAVVIMEPLLGGRLANPPKDIQAIIDEGGTKRSSSDLALQWLWDQSEVSVVLSGMSNMKQVEENIASANNSGVGILDSDEFKIIERIRQKYNERAAVPCTACYYCMPCPNNVDIPRNFELYNGGVVHDDVAGSRTVYNNFVDKANRASACVDCKICEDKCPQRIPISEWMPKVHKVLG